MPVHNLGTGRRLQVGLVLADQLLQVHCSTLKLPFKLTFNNQHSSCHSS
jgi:hypothetical protein